MAPKAAKPRRKRGDQLKIGNCVLAERKPRYAKGFDKGLARLAELDRLIADRYGQFLPPEQLDAFLTVAAMCLKDAHGWLARYAPYVADVDAVLEPIKRAQESRRWNYSVAEAGAKVALTFAERQRLGIAMWAADVPLAEQKARVKKARRERERERIAEKRKAQRELKPRSEWLAEHSIQQSRPWEAEGISERTWYRRRQQVGKGVLHLAQEEQGDLGKGMLQPAHQGLGKGMLQPESSFGTLILTSNTPLPTPPITPSLEDLVAPGGGSQPPTEDSGAKTAGRSRAGLPDILDLLTPDTNK